MKKITSLICLLILAGMNSVNSQTINVIASGFAGPAGITKDTNGNLYVAEAGTGNNDGKITMIDPVGTKFTIAYGLPSFTDTATHETSGPWRAYVTNDSTMYVIQGGGPDTNAGSIIQFNLASVIPGTDSLTLSDTVATLNILHWALANGFTDSNIFSADLDNSGNAYVADAGANAIFKVDTSLNISVLDTFPAIPNTFTPFPPFIDYVPTRIIAGNNDEFYLCNLTGFPFIPGLSQVVRIDTTGVVTPIYSGLTQAVDMQIDNAGNIYVLQFGLYDTSFVPVMGSASIVRLSQGGNLDTLATGFGPAAGMVLDSADGFYVTELMTGNVLHITNTTVGIENPSKSVLELTAYPNPFDNKINLTYILSETSTVTYTITDVSGKIVFSNNAGIVSKGKQIVPLDLNKINSDDLPAGIYHLTITSGKDHQTINIMKK